MATIYGIAPPSAATYLGSSQLGGTHTGANGDIFVSTATRNQSRFGSTSGVGGIPAWTQIVPAPATVPQTVKDWQPRTTLSDTRADVIPSGGITNERLAKKTNSHWDLEWSNAADGVATEQNRPEFTYSTAATVWDVTHSLGRRFVDVTVVSPGNNDPSAEQTIVVPDIDFYTANACRLTFTEAMTGTVIVRR